MSILLTQKRLQEQLHYNQNSGIFTWRAVRVGVKFGGIAGHTRNGKYVVIGLDSNLYYAHRLAWLYVHGYFPEGELDHINRVCSDNRIKNLRHVSRKCNRRNVGNTCMNNSGIKGVYSVNNDVWAAQIKNNGVMKYLGRFKDFGEAVCVRLAAEQSLDWAGCDSCSPAYQHVKTIIEDIK